MSLERGIVLDLLGRLVLREEADMILWRTLEYHRIPC